MFHCSQHLSNKMKKVLMLAYFYPPYGGAGVQRTVKFAKYLPTFGWSPFVVAGTGGSSIYHQDPELAKEVLGIPRYDIKFSLFEDKCQRHLQNSLGRWTRTTMMVWLRVACRVVEQAITKEKPDLLYVSTSPFPAYKICAYFSKKFSIPWVMDMRDPWVLDPISRYPTYIHYLLEKKEMANACKLADAVIMNTPGALIKAKSIYKDSDKSKFFCITNGWDKDDFIYINSKNKEFSKRMCVVHTGQFHTKTAINLEKRNNPAALTRYTLSKINLLTRTPNYLFASYRKLIDEDKVSSDSIQFIFAGSYTDDIRLVSKYGIESSVKFTGYLNHSQSIGLLNNADVLFLPLHQLEDSSDPLIIPGKTFEYIASKRPILACIPPGDARDIVLKSGLAYVCDSSNIDQIAKTLLDLLKQHNSPEKISINPDQEYIERFERRQLTKDLCRVFDFVLATPKLCVSIEK